MQFLMQNSNWEIISQDLNHTTKYTREVPNIEEKLVKYNELTLSPARSPVFGHLNATVMGLATVRSFGAEYLLGAEFDRHQDLHSAAWYLFISCSRAFGYFLDVICLLFIICVTFSCLMKTG